MDFTGWWERDRARLVADLHGTFPDTEEGRLAAAEALGREVVQEVQALRGSEKLLSFEVGPAKAARNLGVCRFSYGEPVLVFVRDALVKALPLGDGQVTDVILHEAAHALAGLEAGHGREWQEWASILGAKPERCASITNDLARQIAEADGEAVILCRECDGFVTSRKRVTRALLEGYRSRCCSAALKVKA